MWESRWDDLLQKNKQIEDKILRYNQQIAAGRFLESDQSVDIAFYYDILAAHIINLLLDNESFFLPANVIEQLNIKKSKLMIWVKWSVSENYSLASKLVTKDKQQLIGRLIQHCFDSKRKECIQEICAQDIINGNTLAKDIDSILSYIHSAIEIEVIGEEAFLAKMSLSFSSGERFLSLTKIQRKFGFEYSNRGALIRNRVFKHSFKGKTIPQRIKLMAANTEALDYRECGNFCQAALLHIGIESTGSTGTGFVISKDGYALTCAHVVEGAKEVYATVINGDGYIGNNESRDGFTVYDAGDGEVVYINKQLDIALLKMEHSGSGYLPIEQRNILPELGDEVVVFGYP